MDAADRHKFSEEMAVLFGIFSKRASRELLEGYWRSLQSMPIDGFLRAAEKAARDLEYMPKPQQLWAIHKAERAEFRRVETPGRPANDAFAAFGQRCLLVFLRKRGPVTDASLQRLIAVKNRLAAEFRDIATECEVEAKEVREALFSAFDRECEPA